MSKANRSLYIFSVNKSFLCSFIKVLKHIQVKEFTASEALQTWAKTNVCTERQSGFKKKEKKENTNSVNRTEIKPLTDVKILTVRNTDGMLKST